MILPVLKISKMNVLASLSNLFILPVLLLISIPLALSASITAFLALATLFVRALVVYFELSIALAVHFFLFPAQSPASGSFLALSGATTPAADRSPSRTRTSHSYYHHSQVHSGRSSNAKPWKESWHSKEVVSEDYFFQHNHHSSYALMSPHEVLSNFVSGNAERDFEGVGGWRTPLSSRKKSRRLSASSVSYNSSDEELGNDEDDEQAWVSMNKRLELPSRHLNFASPNVVSPVVAMTETVEEPLKEWQQNNHQRQRRPSQQLQRPRFHRRSVTTPLLPMSSAASALSLQSSSTSSAEKQLQTSKSSAGLQSLASFSFPRPSTTFNALLGHTSSTSVPPPLSWHEAPFLMTPAGFGTDSKMVHYPSFSSRRRRSLGGSSAAPAAATTSKAMAPTGLGLS